MNDRRDQRKARWWQTMPPEDFVKRIVGMRDEELQGLHEEIKGAVAFVQSQLETRGKTDMGWWKSARSAHGFMIEKDGLIKSELSSRRATYRKRRKLVVENLDIVLEGKLEEPGELEKYLNEHSGKLVSIGNVGDDVVAIWEDVDAK